jgi:hypothetical protein
MITIKISRLKPFNAVAKDLRTPKYRHKVFNKKKVYNRSAEKQIVLKEQYAHL